MTISVLHRPVEQLISRSVAERRTHGAAIGPVLRAAAKIQGVVALGFAAVALALRVPLRDDLFSGSTTIYWIYVGAVLAFAASFFARGFLAGEGHFGLLAGLLVSESFSRMAFSLAVAVGIAAGRNAVAAGVVAAPLFSLSVVPLAFGRRAARAPAAAPGPAPGDESSRAVLARGGAFAGAVLLIMLSEQIFLNAGPLFVHAIEGSAQAGYIFNVLMLARAPLLVFQGIAISLLPHLTRLRSRGRADAEEAFSVSVELTLRAIAASPLFVGAIVAIAGPKLMQIAFSDRFTYDRAGSARGDGGDGPLPGLDDAQPGCPCARALAARGGVLDRLRRGFLDLEPAADADARAPNRGRLPGCRGGAFRPAPAALPGPLRGGRARFDATSWKRRSSCADEVS